MVVTIGTPGRDIFQGGGQGDVLVGLGDIDQLNGFGGPDIVMGNQDTDVLGGGVGNDILSGGEGNDLLEGREDDDALNGGTGEDDMRGGSGNDRYVVDNINDIVDEGDSINEDSNDLVASFLERAILPDRIENLTLLGTAIRQGRGNALSNRIVGNSADNILVGSREIRFASDDADVLIGQDGNDIYYVDNAGDSVTEAANQGDADVIATGTAFYRLPDNVETLTMADPYSSPLMITRGFGNQLDNEIYGGGVNNQLAGLEGNDTIQGGSGGSDTLEGGEGNDKYIVFDPVLDIVKEANLDGSDPGGLEEVTSYAREYTLPERVENLVLVDLENISSVFNGFGNSEANFIQGNRYDNVLGGGDNDDTLTGGQGNDILDGGAGDDIYLFHLGDGVDQVNGNDLVDTIRFDDAIGQDQVAFFHRPFQRLEIGYTSNSTDLITTQASAFGSLVGRFELQNGLFMNSADLTRLHFILSAYATAHGISFNSLDDIKSSLALRDIIANSWRVGPDVAFTPFIPIPPPMIASSPSSNLGGTALGDILIGGTGTNLISSEGGADYAMGGDGFDILIGGEGNDTLSAGNGNDSILGGSGFDILNGGVGNDYMEGGSGDDFYMVDNQRDLVIENVNGGYDTIVSSISYSLPSTSVPNSSARTWNVEVLRLIGTGNIGGIGSPVNDEIIGNEGDNTLDGRGGIDILRGGEGNDTYVADNTQDRVIELANQGDADRVNSTVDYTLPVNVEMLLLEGNQDINGTGNNLENILFGNNGINFLNGGDGNDIIYGSPGDDALIGGRGDDRYVVFDDSGDAITELAGEGRDEVKSYVSYSLAFSNNVENLILGTLIDGENANNINGFGNSENNHIEGNRGNNMLTGGMGNDYIVGAQGNDTLRGESDNDTYLFRLGDGVDEVIDDAGVQDALRFNNSIAQDSIIFFRAPDPPNPSPQDPEPALQIGYAGSTDRITLTNQTSSVTAIERFELENGLYMDAEDVNRIIDAMSQYASDNNISLDSLAVVEGNTDLMNIVNSGWHI